MSAVVVVRDNPFFAKAAADGSLRHRGRARRQATCSRPGTSARGEALGRDHGRRPRARSSAQLTLDASTFKRAPHKNKFGKDYAADEKY